MDCDNFTYSESFQIMSESEKYTLETLHFYLYSISTPIVCCIGFLGNILNIVVFTKKKKSTGGMDDMENCSTVVLLALAASDMLFCLTVFPVVFQDPRKKSYQHTDFMLFYNLYSNTIISVFILSSTLLTVLVAVMRFLAICHPFRARRVITVKRSVLAIGILFLFSVAFNLPSLWQRKTIHCMHNYVKIINNDSADDSFMYIQKILWAIVGNFIPLLILFFCNIHLIRAIRSSEHLQQAHHCSEPTRSSSHRRINIAMIAIITCFFILVAPSEFTKFIALLGNNNRFVFFLVSYVTNTLQCVNFSINFVLYYIIIAPFRKILRDIMCTFPSSRGRKKGPPQLLVEVSTKERHHLFLLYSLKKIRHLK